MSDSTRQNTSGGAPAAGATGAKICIHCKQDCSGKPRIKDPSGLYACKACVEAASRQPVSAAVPAMSAADAGAVRDSVSGLDDGPIDLGVGEAASSVKLPECAGCSMPYTTGTQVCMNCGYNIAKGRPGQTKVSKQLVTAGEVTSLLTTANPIMWAVGGCIGGAIGAAIWIAVVVSLERQIGYVALGVGALTGLGVAAVARSRAGTFSGIMAAVIALVALGVGKYGVVSVIVDREVAAVNTQLANKQFTDENAMSMIADELCKSEEAKGVKLVWPNGMSIDDAVGPADYPPGIWTKAAAQWNAATPTWQEEYKAAQLTTIKAEFAAGIGEAKDEIFRSSFRPFDVLWAFLALGAAFKIGAGFSSDD